MKKNELIHRQGQELRHRANGLQAGKASSGLRRLTLWVSDQEREELSLLVESEGYGESVREILECFISDLSNSSRRRWPYGREGARHWLESHRASLEMQKACTEKGGH